MANPPPSFVFLFHCGTTALPLIHMLICSYILTPCQWRRVTCYTHCLQQVYKTACNSQLKWGKNTPKNISNLCQILGGIVMAVTTLPTVQFSSVQDGIYALGKAYMSYIPSLSSFLNIAFEMVPMFIWSMMALSSFQGWLSAAETWSKHCLQHSPARKARTETGGEGKIKGMNLVPDLAVSSLCNDHLPLKAVHLFFMFVQQPDHQLKLGPTVPASCVPEHQKNRRESDSVQFILLNVLRG